MGAGKSTIGKLLAAQLGYTFCDTDTLIEERAGADILWIFDVEGERGFRQRETVVLEDVIKRDKQVIATGGGIVTTPANRELLCSIDYVFYLTASIEQLVERTHKDKKRPLLQVENPQQKIIDLAQKRDPLYREVAKHTVLTDGRSLKTVVQQIIKLIH